MEAIITRREVRGERLSQDIHPVMDRVLRGRGIGCIEEIDTSTQRLAHFGLMKGSEAAASRLADAIQQQRVITIIGDFDADGATSTALCMLALKAFLAERVNYLVPNRFDFGYGLSEGIVDIAAAQGTEVIMTVDSGIACHAGVERARALGMQVIVTDHHLPGEQLPNAHAIVNPNQPGCTFPSKAIAGVGVAFYVMLALRSELQRRGYFDQQGSQAPNLASLLDIVAVGTVADVVVLDRNNRVLVQQGLSRIRSGHCRPGIKALIDVSGRVLHNLSASDLGFVVGPRLNAAGRLDDMALGIELLLEEDKFRAQAMAVHLDQLNMQRRAIEAEMKADAERVLNDMQAMDSQSVPAGIVLYRPDFHQGVIGIVAGRIKDMYRRPCIVFAQQDEQWLKGSARSVEGLHIRDLLEEVNRRQPGLIEKFGGHAMAAGLSIQHSNLAVFERAFTRVVTDSGAVIGRAEYLTDGELSSADMSLPLAQQMRFSVPFGQGFVPPLFDGVFRVLSQRIIKEKYLKLVLANADGMQFDAMAFSIDISQWPQPAVQHVRVVYRLDVNEYQGRQTLQLLVEHLVPATGSSAD